MVLFVGDSVITLSAIAYNVNNDLDEVLLVIVCAVYSGNIITQYLQVSWYFGVIGLFNFVGLISNCCWCF